MKKVEDRLRELPEIAENMGVDASAQLKYRIRNAARDRMNGRRMAMKILGPAVALALVLCIGLGAVVPSLQMGKEPKVDPLTAQAAGDGSTYAMERSALLDVPQGSISISASGVPDYRSIWAGSGANFPLVAVNGQYFRMLTTPATLSGSLKGEELGKVSVYTAEPALVEGGTVVSNTVAEGESIYAVKGMNGVVCANVEGNLRVFQRIGYGDSAVMGAEKLGDTLPNSGAIALELSGVGSIHDSGKAQELMDMLLSNAVYQRAASGETGSSLLVFYQNGITVQLAVSDEKVIGCGTWACPDFFDAFEAAAQ